LPQEVRGAPHGVLHGRRNGFPGQQATLHLTQNGHVPGKADKRYEKESVGSEAMVRQRCDSKIFLKQL
jgi:hypothetical protein